MEDRPDDQVSRTSHMTERPAGADVAAAPTPADARRAGRSRRRTISRIAAVGAGLLIVAAAAPAAHSRPERRFASAYPVGTWEQIVHLPQGDEQTMLSLHADGTVSSMSPESSMPCPSGSGTCELDSSSVGIWKATGARTFEYAIKEYVYDSDGGLVNFIEPHGYATLSYSGNSYTAKNTTGIWTAQGQLLLTMPATADGTRMSFPSY